MNPARLPAAAGSFYPADADELSLLMDECFDASPLGPKGQQPPATRLIAGMIPHAGYIYSGACAAHLYARLDVSVRRIILLGVNHRARGYRAALSPWVSWETPLGQVRVDPRLQEFLQSRVAFLKSNEPAHSEEHSIEVQLPFLQRILREFSFLPISLSRLNLDECVNLGAAIAEACRTNTDPGDKTIVLASSDLSHYLSPEETDELDHAALEKVLSIDPRGLLRIVEERGISMCGVLPAAVMLSAAKSLGAERARLLQHCHSGQVSPMKKVVGYASVSIEL